MIDIKALPEAFCTTCQINSLLRCNYLCNLFFYILATCSHLHIFNCRTKTIPSYSKPVRYNFHFTDINLVLSWVNIVPLHTKYNKMWYGLNIFTAELEMRLNFRGNQSHLPKWIYLWLIQYGKWTAPSSIFSWLVAWS